MKTVDRQGWSTETKRPGRGGPPWGRRLRVLIFALLTMLALHGLGYGLGAYLYSGTFEETSDKPEKQADVSTIEQPPVEQPPEPPAAAPVEEDAGPLPPQDPTLYLTVPRLGLYGHTVRNDRSEEALDLGAVKLPSTGFPWEKGANTYMACHRLGFPGTESYNQCLNLPAMQQGDEVTLTDANGTVYHYRVSEMLTVGPNDSWVTEPVVGREIISLQTCIEAPGDFFTLGPNWAARFVVRADRIR